MNYHLIGFFQAIRFLTRSLPCLFLATRRFRYLGEKGDLSTDYWFQCLLLCPWESRAVNLLSWKPFSSLALDFCFYFFHLFVIIDMLPLHLDVWFLVPFLLLRLWSRGKLIFARQAVLFGGQLVFWVVFFSFFVCLWCFCTAWQS